MFQRLLISIDQLKSTRQSSAEVQLYNGECWTLITMTSIWKKYDFLLQIQLTTTFCNGSRVYILHLCKPTHVHALQLQLHSIQLLKFYHSIILHAQFNDLTMSTISWSAIIWPCQQGVQAPTKFTTFTSVFTSLNILY